MGHVMIRSSPEDSHLLHHVVGIDQALLQQHQERGLRCLPHLAVRVSQEPSDSQLKDQQKVHMMKPT